MQPRNNEIALTQRDLDLLSVLTRRVRVLSMAQVARTWWADSSEEHALRRNKRLAAAGYVHLFKGVGHPELLLDAPVCSWRPSELMPDFSTISYQLKHRWSGRPRLVPAVSASSSAGRRFGSHGGRKPRESEFTHDLHLAGVYLRFRMLEPVSAERWIFEEEIRARRGQVSEKLPDALIELPDGPRIIEFGGAYGRRKLEAFHEYCACRELPYEVW